jgi:hypothetical protein
MFLFLMAWLIRKVMGPHVGVLGFCFFFFFSFSGPLSLNVFWGGGVTNSLCLGGFLRGRLVLVD